MADENKEFLRSHQGGWGRIPLPKSEKLRVFRWDTVGDWNGKATECGISFITPKGITKNVKVSLDYILTKAKWFLPESKYINVGLGTLRAVANPLRQYSKALTLQNVTFQSALPFLIPQEVSTIIGISTKNAMAFYATEYPTYFKAFEKINAGELFSAAFDKRFLLSMHPELQYPVLIYRGHVIGYDEGRRVIVTKDSECWRATLSELVHKEVVFQ